MKKTHYFSIKELVHPQILNAIGEDNSWLRLDADCLIDLDSIRGMWAQEVRVEWPNEPEGILINAGAADSRGLRPPNDPDGGFYSVHKQGKAFDLVPANGRHKKFYAFVKELIETGFCKAFNTMEDSAYTPTWCHVAKMNHSKKILIIRP